MRTVKSSENCPLLTWPRRTPHYSQSKFKPDSERKQTAAAKKSIFNLIFHHHSRLAHCDVYYFPKGLSSFFHTHTPLLPTTLRVCVRETIASKTLTPRNPQPCPDVGKPWFASTPSIHGGGATVHTLAFFFIRNTHTHTPPFLFTPFTSKSARNIRNHLVESGFRSYTGTTSSPL